MSLVHKLMKSQAGKRNTDSKGKKIIGNIIYSKKHIKHVNTEGLHCYICNHSASNIVIKNKNECTNIVFPGCKCSQHKEPRMYEGSGRSCLKRTINVKAPGIMGEVLNLTKQSCTNTTTSKPYLRRKWRENRQSNA